VAELFVRSMNWKEHGVKIVRAGDLDSNTPQTPGMTRAAAITHARTGASKLWAGNGAGPAECEDRPHINHGELETVLYVVRGRARMRWGDQLECTEGRTRGFHLRASLCSAPEINARRDEPCEAVVVRSGQEPVVVNLEMETPEPASAGGPAFPFHPRAAG